MFRIDFASRTPIYEQLVKSIIRLVSVGALKTNDRLPPVRTVATQLGVNPNTVSKAYNILESDGYVCSVVGKGTFINDKMSLISAKKKMAIDSFKSATESAMLLGATCEELKELVKEIYRGGKQSD